MHGHQVLPAWQCQCHNRGCSGWELPIWQTLSAPLDTHRGANQAEHTHRMTCGIACQVVLTIEHHEAHAANNTAALLGKHRARACTPRACCISSSESASIQWAEVGVLTDLSQPAHTLSSFTEVLFFCNPVGSLQATFRQGNKQERTGDGMQEWCTHPKQQPASYC